MLPLLLCLATMSAPAPDTQPEPAVETEPESEPGSETETEPASESEPETETEPESESEPEPEPKSEPEPATPTQVEAEAKPASALGSNVEVSGEPGKGLTVKVGDKFSLNIRSRIQIRYQLDIPNAPADSMRQTVNIGTARLWLSGNIISPKFLYMIQLAVAGRDYRDNAISPVYDAYIDWKAHRDINLRAGQFFVPFDRLRTVREWALQMVNRPIPVGEMTLDRDVGLLAYSDRFLGDRSPVAWRIGVFGGGGTNLTRGKKPGALVVARVELRPLGPMDDDTEGDLERRRRPALALGIGGAGNFNTNRLRSTTGPVFQGGTTTYAHGTADLVFKVRGFAIQGEYLIKRAAHDTIESITEEGDPRIEATRSGQGWIAQLSYVFDPPIEIVARLSATYAFRGTDPVWREELRLRGQEVGAGLNYYINGHKFKVQAGWIARMPRDFAFARADHLVAAQVDVTF